MKKIICAAILMIGFILNSTAQTTKKTVAKAPVSPSIVNGKLVYTKYCMVCHQIDGGGVMGLNPPLSKTEYVLGDQKRLINIVLKGFNTEIEIDGDTYANPMPGLGHLTDQQVADVLSFVRNSFGNKASVITPAQVKVVRASK
ncbi:c-type cytochrome [Pedobacter sp. LMG 31464]|uniref:C-type cytochrome n=1 Tax=Pedobacter planticolens TaxID=2679964 RepID=A0A923IVG1_9SPHI|nr:cytochrome c [Pedobacter planticolens]MBB2145139.1 c-type cytochrome [Pedobacter planticolens]